MARSPNEIPSFVRASTPELLKREMLRINHKLGYQNRFFDFQFVNGAWYCWYYYEPSSLQEILKDPEKIAVKP